MRLNSVEELDRELTKGKSRPVYLILGPELYQSRRAIDLLKSRALNSDAIAFDYSEFTAGEAPVDEIMKAADTFPMVSKRRVVLVHNVEKLKDLEQEALIESLGNLSPRSMLILYADELDHRKRFYKYLKEEHCVAEFARLKGTELEKWADAYVRGRGHTLSPAAGKKIVDLAGPDLLTLAMELDKLLLYAGNSEIIPDSAVDDLVRGSRQQTIFELITAVEQKDQGAALRSLGNLLGMGEHPLMVVTMMARHCRQVMIVQELLRQGSSAREAGAAAQVPPFLQDKFVRQARSADPDSIRRMFITLADIDRKIKSSSADGRLLLENLIYAFV